LKYTVKQVLDGQTIRGEVVVGLAGELLQADPPFTSVPVRAKKPMQTAADGSLTIEYTSPPFTMHAKAGPLMMVTRRMNGAATGEFVLTDPSGHPVQIENSFPGEPFVGLIEGDLLRWTVTPKESTTETVSVPSGGIALYPTRLFTTVDWEASFASVGTKKDGLLLLMKAGSGESVLIERLEDVEQVHRYRLSGSSFRAELLTDGKQLLAMRTPDGVSIVREGSAALITQIKPLEWVSVTLK
jgi:hypothetical protein